MFRFNIYMPKWPALCILLVDSLHNQSFTLGYYYYNYIIIHRVQIHMNITLIDRESGCKSTRWLYLSMDGIATESSDLRMSPERSWSRRLVSSRSCWRRRISDNSLEIFDCWCLCVCSVISRLIINRVN